MDKKVKPIQKPVIKRSEMEQFEADAEKAKELLEAPEFKFFRDYLVSEKEAIINDFVNNRIHKVVEHRQQPSGSSIEVTHTKEEQSAELSGRFKFIFELIAKLEQVRDLPSEALRAQEDGKVTIETKEK